MKPDISKGGPTVGREDDVVILLHSDKCQCVVFMIEKIELFET